ncbi:MAG: hypothetical protein VB106_10115 [Clostridiaceae bacterium]|nr:hypothetical protein [Clostridiaceae bacterium]
MNKSIKPGPTWTHRYKENWDEAYKNMMAWWHGESNGRPVVLTGVPKSDASPFMPSKDPGTNEARDLDEQYQFERNLHFVLSRLFPAESVPYVSTGFASSIGMLAGMAGAVIKYDDKTAWVEADDDLYERPLPGFSEGYLPYKTTINLMHRHIDYYGYDCIIGSDAMMDPITMLSMMRGVEKLCYDLYDRPEDVRRWLDRLSDIRYRMAEGYKKVREHYGRSEEINWTGAWAPGEMDCLECDFSTMISSSMFNDIVMPEVEKEASYYEYCLWHLDGLAEVKHLESICSVGNIYAIQWVAEKQDGSLNYIDLFKKIRNLGRSLLISCSSADEAVALTRQIGKDGLALSVGGIKTEKEMEILLKRLVAI